MSEQDKETQIWMGVLTVVPVVFLSNLFKELRADDSYRLLLSAAGGVIGGLIGFGLFYISKEKSRIFKILIFTGLLLALIIITYWFQSVTDSLHLEEKSV